MNDRTLLAGRDPLVFAGSPLDRGDLLRRDESAMDTLLAGEDGWWMGLVEGDPVLQQQGGLYWFRRHEIADLADMDAGLFLGHYKGSPCFSAVITKADSLPLDGEISPARQAAMALSHDEAAIYAQAKALHAWHGRHGFCAACGETTRIKSGGGRRICNACESEHFPRVDPVVIMLATDGDRCLLGRQASWPEGVWSALAGFVEPAETLEEACARELEEEAGVKADIAAIRYVMGQPWPFPSSLMIGLVAPVFDASLTIDTHELEQARWFSRDEVRDMLATRHPDATMPPSIAIARRLAELWADEVI
ncbi:MULTISPECIES: NAD(+) diphosphatase [Maricaulis]|jgi:NAD+ diphosphatase|uniref:NAD(+) diphosphatase n=1 Tax=Maricaulis maris (strain MCS10) TaxID=394221 RepID=Q0ASL1_MARMM|nr:MULTISPECIES: NAD(+) diphosphatase [Maricaulis]ABI64726.1 NUDIX hydrolase [Maricaulis maris MCS10]MAC88195.1 NAD(+) diphosphatase [Maricaulis sp.]